MRAALGAVTAVYALAASLGLGAIVGTTMVLPFLPIRRGRRERWTILGAQLWARMIVRGVLACGVRTRGEIAVTEGRGALLVCNHRSWLDPLLLMGWTRSNGLSKQSILFIPVIGVYAWLAGAVFFDRGDRGARARARREVRDLVLSGHRLQVFPEGTRSRDGKLRTRVFLTLVRDAWNDGVPVVPCAVAGTERVLPPTAFAAHLFQSVDLAIGETIYPTDHPDEESFAIAVWARVKAMTRELHGEPG